MTLSLGDRMKKYEKVSRTSLMPKTPIIIRIDGKAFHTWTKGLETPFDERFYAAMAKTTQDLVNNIQGAVFGYGQSDEISIFLKDYDTYDTQAWFDGQVQKIVSVAASLATAFFNNHARQLGIGEKLAFFDARAFSLPAHEVTNYFIWRQQDFHRNSIQMVGQHFLGHKKMHGLKTQDVVDTLRELDDPVDWYKDYDTVYRRGYVAIKGADKVNFDLPDFVVMRDFIEVHVQIDV